MAFLIREKKKKEKRKEREKCCTWVKRRGHQYGARKSTLGMLIQGERLRHLWLSKDPMPSFSGEVPQGKPLGHRDKKCLTEQIGLAVYDKTTDESESLGAGKVDQPLFSRLWANNCVLLALKRVLFTGAFMHLLEQNVVIVPAFVLVKVWYSKAWCSQMARDTGIVHGRMNRIYWRMSR